MNLSIKERIILQSILPKEGSFTNLKLMRETKEALSFTEEEHKKYNITMHDGGMITWNDPDNDEVDIPMSSVVSSLIKSTLEKMDKEEKLDEDRHYSLYEKFVLGV